MVIDVQALKIVTLPDPVLRRRAQNVAEITDEVRAVAHRMIELMHEAEGIGLAAPQVGLPWRMFVVDVPADNSPDNPADPDDSTSSGSPGTAPALLHSREPTVYINPRLSGYSRDLVPYEEGCLSLPKITGTVRRPSMVTVDATAIDGTPFAQSAGGLLARCIQHEHDHLEGVLIIDKMPTADRLKNRSLIRELEASGARR